MPLTLLRLVVLICAAGSLWAGPSGQAGNLPDSADQPRSEVHPISFGGREFIDAFNAAIDRPRLVIVFSPT